MNLNALIPILITSIFCISAMAQESKTDLEDIVDSAQPKPARQMLQIDLIPTAISLTTVGKPGFGLIYNYRLGQNFALGAFAELNYFNDEDGLLFYRDIEFQSVKYGLELRGYLSQFGQGFYGSIGPAFARMEVEAEGRLSNAGAFAVSDSIDQNGFLSRIGYTFGSKTKTDSIIIDVAFEYGAGNSWEYSGDSTGQFEMDSLSDSLSLNVGLGARF